MKTPLKMHDQSGRTGQAGRQGPKRGMFYVFNITREMQNG